MLARIGARGAPAKVRWMQQLARWYERRIVNVNVNIVLAGAMAMAITVAVMRMVVTFGLGNKFAITGLTFLVDLVADVGVYFVLHWVANHAPNRPRVVNAAYGHLSYVKDATLVQFERAVLSPLLYVIALGLQHTLLRLDWGVGWATAIGFTAGIACSRSLHTMWMLRQERRAEAKLKTGAVQAAKVEAPAPMRKGA